MIEQWRAKSRRVSSPCEEDHGLAKLRSCESDGGPQARFSFAILWPLSSGFLRVPRNPTGAPRA